MRRGRSPWRDWPLLGWFVAAVVVALGHRWLPDASWLLLHLVFLGAVTHSIMVWSAHFSQTLLRLPAPSGQDARLALLTAGAALVLVGVPTTWWPVTLVGGLAVAAAVGWHGVVLTGMLRRALPARFRVTVRYYLTAAGCLVVGIGFGVTLAWGWDDTWHGRLLVAHALTNVLGWVGLTLTGTLLTLWPTMLRTRMDAAAEVWTRRALPVFCAGILVADAGALGGLAWLAAAGLVIYLAALGLWGRTLWQPLRTKPLTEFAPASVAAAMVWLVVGLVWAGWVLVTSPDWEGVREDFVWPAAALGAGFGVQLLTGALSYLLPSVLGGGPSVVRAGQHWFNAGAGFRLVAINGGLLLWLAPTPSWVKVSGSLLALGAAAAFLPIMVAGIRASVAARRIIATGGQVVEVPSRPSVGSAGQLIAGLTALVTVAVVGVGIDQQAAGAAPQGSPAGSVVATGAVIRVKVEIREMRYHPSQVSVAAGDRLVVELTNADTNTHDLVIGAARTPRIGPGRTVELDAGIMSGSTQGYCSVVGHRQLGMVLDVVVTGTPAAPSAAAIPGATHDMGTMPADGAALSGAIDPVLPPLESARVHRLTLTAKEVPLEVAPGVWQRRWTFNGRAPGPTLHGRVGDVFEVTLVNSATIGHSIDFHAGALAPDRPMRTIQPGESLVYRFTATRAGVWMYHCSTMPMTAHIGAGMFGAVVIEPEGLSPVDRSYVLVQSETYLQTAAHDAASATEVNADAVKAENPSYVAFNGIANGYDSHPLDAAVGDRVRFWVLDAGPNRASSFHIVGTQFDTVYAEGAYLLRRGRDAFGTRHGGAQSLALQAAQGGFVETTFGEAGRYAMVSHSMVDAERGAHGFVVVR
ncbi:MAG TPA: multicopper oxidase domain-containing protein [Propionicimonas sp.]|uniref:multicopper oxidase domain-containing protein n=1 Tax=Propionicimonas sp. TaxID=1955623 RepID=UPI002F3F9136